MKPSSITRRGLSHAKANVVFRQTLWQGNQYGSACRHFLLIEGSCHPWGPIGFHCVGFLCVGEEEGLAIVPLRKFILKLMRGDS